MTNNEKNTDIVKSIMFLAYFRLGAGVWHSTGLSTTIGGSLKDHLTSEWCHIFANTEICNWPN